MREFVFFSQQTNLQYKKITFYTQYRSYFIASRTKTCFALCPDSFGLQPVSRDFLAFERPDGLSQAKKSLETGLRPKESGRSAKIFFVPAPIKYDLYFEKKYYNILKAPAPKKLIFFINLCKFISMECGL